MRLAALPTVAGMYPEVHNRFEAKRAKRAELLTELVMMDDELADLQQEKISMAQCVLQQLGTDSEGQTAAQPVAEYLAARHLAAATSFREAIQVGCLARQS